MRIAEIFEEDNFIPDLSIFNYTDEMVWKRFNNDNLVKELIQLQKELISLKNKFIKYSKQDILKLLNDNTFTQASISSNAIERIFETYTNLHRLITSKDKTQNRTQEQVLGYYKALSETLHFQPEISIQNIVLYHSYIEDDGLKKANNCIKNGSDGKIIFIPASAKVSETYLELITQNFNKPIDDLYLCKVILFNYDFLAIHPFDDGNGRTSRILFNWMLKPIAPIEYISVESVIYAKLSKYYDALQKDNESWYEPNEAYITHYGSFIAEVVESLISIGIKFIKTHLWNINGAKEIYQTIINLPSDNFTLDELYDEEDLLEYCDVIEEVVLNLVDLFLIGKSGGTFSKFVFQRN